MLSTMSGLSSPQNDPALTAVAAQAYATASARPGDVDAQLTYLSMLYRLNRNPELLEHVRSGRFASNGQIRNLADAAAAKVTRNGAGSEAASAASSAGSASVPPPPMGYASGFPAGANGYPPYPGGAPGGYPPQPGYPAYPPQAPGYGYPPPPPPGYGYPQQPQGGYGYPQHGGGGGGGGGNSDRGGGYSDRGGDDGQHDGGDRSGRGLFLHGMGTNANPLKVQAIARFGMPEAMRMLFGGLVWVLGVGAILFAMQSATGGGMARGGGGGIGDMLRGDSGAVADIPETRFEDVVGVDEAKEELKVSDATPATPSLTGPCTPRMHTAAPHQSHRRPDDGLLLALSSLRLLLCSLQLAVCVVQPPAHALVAPASHAPLPPPQCPLPPRRTSWST